MEFSCTSPRQHQASSSSSASSNNSTSHHNNNVSTRNPSAPVPHEELLQRFENLWSDNDVDLGRRRRTQINGVQEQHQQQRFPYMGSSSLTNPHMGSENDGSVDLGRRRIQINGVQEQHQQRFPYMGSSSSSTNPHMGVENDGIVDLGRRRIQINGVQEHQQRFPHMGTSSSSTNLYMGSSSSSTNHQDEFQRRRYIDNRPTTTQPPLTQAQLMAYLASNRRGALMNSYNDNVGNNNYLSSMNYINGIDHRVPVNPVSRVPVSSMNNYHRQSNGYTLEDQISLLGYIDDQDLDVRNLRFKLIESKGWPVEKVLKIWYDDPSLLDEIEPNDIVMVAELKLGSLYLQKILKDQDPLYFNKIFYATLEDMFRLMTNSEGTYVIRKLHSLCDSSHMNQIVKKIISRPDDLKNAAKNEAGADTLMKLIRVLKSTNQFFHKLVLDSLTSEICIDIMRSKPGSNLFKSCLKYLNSWQNDSLHKWVAAHCIDLAIDESGYFSLIALIENTPNPYKIELLFEISEQAASLSKDNKGNYVIQAILKLRIPEVDLMICSKLAGHYLNLSMDRCASNVVEKCIMSSGMEYPILELILSRKLHLLSQDSMGNYVVQKALDVSQQLKRFDLYDSIVGEIQPYFKELQHHPIGRNVYRHINRKKVIMGKIVECPIPM